MNLGVFVSELCENNKRILERLKAEKLGVFLVGNGVYYSVIKEKGFPVKEGIGYYVLTEDLETRGFSLSDSDSKIKPVTYSDIVDLIMNEHQKLIFI